MPLYGEVGGCFDVGTFAADFDGAIHLAEERIPFSGRYDHEHATGSVAIHRRFAVDEPFRHASSWSGGRLIEAAGTFAVVTRAGRTQDSAYWMEVQGDFFDGHVRVGNVSAHGVLIRGAGRFTGNGPATGEVTFTADAVDTGLLIRSISASASLLHGPRPRVHVSSLTGQGLGGTFSAKGFEFDTESGAEIELRLDGLDVAEILALQGTPLTGTGTLDGLIPLTIHGGESAVSGGRIVARPPGGKLRVANASGLATTHARTLDVALQALEDFRYNRLEAAVDYEADGMLRLGIRLEGWNPDVQRERPIHINANVVQDLPTLLRSLQVASALDVRIEKYFEGLP